MENNNNGNYHQQPPQDNPELKKYWLEKIEEVTDFKEHKFPLSRIKRIMKFDPDVTMIASEAPILLSKACEMFIMDLSMRSWLHAQEKKRSTVHRSDVSAAVARTTILDFLLDVVPEDKPVADPVAIPHPNADGGSEGLPYYIPQEMVIGTPVVGDVGMYELHELEIPGWTTEDWTVTPEDEEDAAVEDQEDAAEEDQEDAAKEEGGKGGD